MTSYLNKENNSFTMGIAKLKTLSGVQAVVAESSDIQQDRIYWADSSASSTTLSYGSLGPASVGQVTDLHLTASSVTGQRTLTVVLPPDATSIFTTATDYASTTATGTNLANFAENNVSASFQLPSALAIGISGSSPSESEKVALRKALYDYSGKFFDILVRFDAAGGSGGHDVTVIFRVGNSATYAGSSAGFTIDQSLTAGYVKFRVYCTSSTQVPGNGSSSTSYGQWYVKPGNFVKTGAGNDIV